MATLAVGAVALMYAQAGVMRAGASRANHHSRLTFVAIAGVQYASARLVDALQVDNDTLTITETAGETPNTCSFEVRGFQPTDGQEVIITQGSINNAEREFAGTVLTDAHSYVGTPAAGGDAVNVIDYTWQLTRRTISQRFSNQSATAIAQAIIALAPGLTSIRVAAGLPVVDEISFTNQSLASALSNLADRIGGTWKATYAKDVRFGIAADASQTDPTTLTAASALLTEMNDFRVTRDLSQVITRQPVEGGGSTSVAACAVGETQIPVTELSWYNAAGGTVVSGPQRITYTGKTQASPTTAPTVRPLAGTGIEDGAHQWAYTFVTAAGETLPSLLSASVLMETLPTAPAVASIVPSPYPGAGPVVGLTVNYAIAVIKDITQLTVFGFASGITALGTPASVVAAGNTAYSATFISRTDLIGRYIGLFRNDGGGTTWYLMDYIFNGVAAGATAQISFDLSPHNFNSPFSSTFQIAPWVAFSPVNNAWIAVVPTGPIGTTSRKVYRTAAGGAQLKLQQTIANNTATTGVTDTTPDASLGANAPTTDTSGLVLSAVSVTSGATAAGAITMNLSSGAAFLSTGGWVIVAGNMPVRYTGKSTNQLTGIPATGAGSIAAAVPSGSTVSTCVALLGIPASGVGSILYPIGAGDEVNLRVVIDDTAAQAEMSGRMLPTVDDGIIEGAVIQDGRISETEARARGTAQLAAHSALDVAIAYTTRDTNTHAGRTITVNLAAPTAVNQAFKVQQVAISDFNPARWPKRQAQGSSTRFTLEQLLRVARGGA